MEISDVNLKELIETETGQRFNRDGFICCPFHGEKTPSFRVRFDSNANKDKYKCFGCNASGDAIDFIKQLKNIDYFKAREYLGMEVKKSQSEELEDKIKSYIEWEIKNTDYRKNKELLGLFTFTNEKGEAVYFKAKFLDHEGKKTLAYYHIKDDGKVTAKRKGEELPYNLNSVIRAIEADRTIIIVEGEKDANTINSILRGTQYATTSLKGVKNLEAVKYGRYYIVGDTGKAGEEYKKHVRDELYNYAKELRVINLPGIAALGDNKDVTDWLEEGRMKWDLLNAFRRSLDLKSEYELQQDFRGIYKIMRSRDGEKYNFYITDFTLLGAKRLTFMDDETEGVKLSFKSCTGQILEKTGLSTVFDDIRTFKNFLGTLDLAFKSTKTEHLTELKSWINRFWAIENEDVYQGIKFLQKNEDLVLITNEGAITQKGIDKSLVADRSNNIEVIDKEVIGKEELKQLKANIFKFAAPDKSITILGTVLNNMAVYQNRAIKEKLHHLLIVGESGSGKSTILQNVVAAILNYPQREIKSIGMITSFALVKDLSSGNYTSLYDEFKPSALDKYKVQKLSENFRNLYDRTTISRGDKSFRVKDFQLSRPIIIAGEESYPNQEKALIERSAIVYLSKRERTEANTEAMQWIIKNEDILNRFGRSIIDIVLKLSIDDYRKIRDETRKLFPELNNRPLMTAVNIAAGIEIFNLLLETHGLKKLTGYEKHIFQNIKEEILDSGNDAKSTVEQMLILYNSMIEDNRAYSSDEVVVSRGDGLFIRTSEMINEIHEFINRVGSAEVVPLKLKDFKKQAFKSGYLLKLSSKVIKKNNKSIRYDEYSKERIRELNLNAIVEPEMEELPEAESKVIEGHFKK